jgi:hypothetical protein
LVAEAAEAAEAAATTLLPVLLLPAVKRQAAPLLVAEAAEAAVTRLKLTTALKKTTARA